MTYTDADVRALTSDELAHTVAKYAFNSPDFAYHRKCVLCRSEVAHNLAQHNCLTGRL
jgi:hypothetical protein